MAIRALLRSLYPSAWKNTNCSRVIDSMSLNKTSKFHQGGAAHCFTHKLPFILKFYAGSILNSFLHEVGRGPSDIWTSATPASETISFFKHGYRQPHIKMYSCEDRAKGKLEEDTDDIFMALLLGFSQQENLTRLSIKILYFFFQTPFGSQRI